MPVPVQRCIVLPVTTCAWPESRMPPLPAFKADCRRGIAVAVTHHQFAPAVAKHIIANDISRRLHADDLRLAVAAHELVVLDDRLGAQIAVRDRALSDLDRLGAVRAERGHVLEQVVIDPVADRRPFLQRDIIDHDTTARTAYPESGSGRRPVVVRAVAEIHQRHSAGQPRALDTAVGDRPWPAPSKFTAPTRAPS